MNYCRDSKAKNVSGCVHVLAIIGIARWVTTLPVVAIVIRVCSTKISSATWLTFKVPIVPHTPTAMVVAPFCPRFFALLLAGSDKTVRQLLRPSTLPSRQTGKQNAGNE